MLKIKNPYIQKGLLVLSKMCFSNAGQDELDTNTPQGIYSLLRETTEVQTKPRKEERPQEVGDGERLLPGEKTISTV